MRSSSSAASRADQTFAFELRGLDSRLTDDIINAKIALDK
jgi:hypothetical protein